jgi:hypothetical protein
MINQYMKKCSTPVSCKGNANQNYIEIPSSTATIANVKKLSTSKYCARMLGKRDLLYPWRRNQYGASLKSFYKIQLPYNLTIPLLAKHTKVLMTVFY